MYHCYWHCLLLASTQLLCSMFFEMCLFYLNRSGKPDTWSREFTEILLSINWHCSDREWEKIVESFPWVTYTCLTVFIYVVSILFIYLFIWLLKTLLCILKSWVPFLCFNCFKRWKQDNSDYWNSTRNVKTSVSCLLFKSQAGDALLGESSLTH